MEGLHVAGGQDGVAGLPVDSLSTPASNAVGGRFTLGQGEPMMERFPAVRGRILRKLPSRLSRWQPPGVSGPQTRTDEGQCLPFGMVFVLAKITDESFHQLFRPAFPFLRIGIGLPGIQDVAIHTRQ